MRFALRFVVLFAMMGSLSACTTGKGLRLLDSGTAGPDEFSVLPSKPLEAPDSLTALPTPTPGGTNLADQTPLADAAVALGGSPARAPSGDSALLASAQRLGTTENIRGVLAAEDARFRRGRARLGAWNPFGRDRYFQAYARQRLDAYAEYERFRNAGTQVPSAPPAN